MIVAECTTDNQGEVSPVSVMLVEFMGIVHGRPVLGDGTPAERLAETLADMGFTQISAWWRCGPHLMACEVVPVTPMREETE